ncbi:MAG: hypothetical protein JRD88_05905 [Deltaproteobacteria bacterium]|jgi:hypothetical protein|nr:hypothetical protein [Deltaproteobacteria bacterium]
MIRNYINKRKQNIAFLRKVTNEIGKEVEMWSYEKLSKSAEELSFTKKIEGANIYISLEAYEENDAGDLHICIDVSASIPTFPLQPLPSYVFWKRQDGSVYYES